MIIAIGTGEQAVDGDSRTRDDAAPTALDRRTRTAVQTRRRNSCRGPPALPATDEHGRALWQKLMVYTSEATLHNGVPIHRAIVQRLFDSGTASGATVLRGIWGFHGDHKPHGDKLIQLTRQVPVTTIVVDSPDAHRRELRHHRRAHRASTVWSPASWCPPWCRSTATSAAAGPHWPVTTTEPDAFRRPPVGQRAHPVGGRARVIRRAFNDAPTRRSPRAASGPTSPALRSRNATASRSSARSRPRSSHSRWRIGDAFGDLMDAFEVESVPAVAPFRDPA